jgi:hypothetical protein
VPTTTEWDKATVSKMGSTIGVSLLELRVLRQNPSAGSALPRANRVGGGGGKATQRMASS